MSEIEERLEELQRSGLDRRLRMVSGPQGPRVLLDGRPVLLLCSNNYLGLADHPRVREAAAEAAMRWGVGAGGSRLVCGTMTIHRRLEERLATFEQREACLLFGSGYLANIGVIGALAGPGDTIFSDELNHASIVDGCRLSRAEVVVYRHADSEHLEWNIRRHGQRREGAGRLIVTDSLFSMDGDLAPLAEIVELAHAYGARTIVDEAHATGALGPDGRGAVSQAGLQGEVDVIVGTLGKALGSYGAYVCADSEMVRYLVNTARPLIFSTAPSPPAVAAALSALELLQERPHRVRRLRSNALVLREALADEGFAVSPSEMHIIPLVVGEERITDAALPGGDRARRVRPGDPPADRRHGDLAPATGRDGVPHIRRAAHGGRGARPGRRRSGTGPRGDRRAPDRGGRRGDRGPRAGLTRARRRGPRALPGRRGAGGFAARARTPGAHGWRRRHARVRGHPSMSSTRRSPRRRRTSPRRLRTVPASPSAPFDIERETAVPRAA